ncbi:MAG: hypothetical protein ACFFDF_25580 [Candidatus Odinarchaeota archaeon]
MSREVLFPELWRKYQKKFLKTFSFLKRRKIKCKYCGKKYKDWNGPGYIGLNVGDGCVCGTCSNERSSFNPQGTLLYHVRIEYKDSDTVVYKDMKVTAYPKFLEEYPDKAISMGLGEPRISVEKKFESQEGIKIELK